MTHKLATLVVVAFVLTSTVLVGATSFSVGVASAANDATPTTSPTPTESTPTEAPTETPTEAPTETPTEAPTETPTEAPTETPTEASAETPTEAPTETPTGPVEIDSCTVIDEPGTYRLVDDLTAADVDACIAITSNDVVFDGGGHTLDGVDGSQSANKTVHYGVAVHESVTSNVTVRNLVVTDWTHGVHLEDATGVTVEDVTAATNRVGVVLHGATDSVVRGATVTDSTVHGVRLKAGANGNLVDDSEVTRSGKHGVFLNNAGENTFRDVTVTASTKIGLKFGSGSLSSGGHDDHDDGESHDDHESGDSHTDDGHDDHESGDSHTDDGHDDCGQGVRTTGNVVDGAVVIGSGEHGVVLLGPAADTTLRDTTVRNNGGWALFTLGGTPTTADRLTVDDDGTVVSLSATDVALRDAAVSDAPATDYDLGRYLEVQATGPAGELDLSFHYRRTDLPQIDSLQVYQLGSDGWSAVGPKHDVRSSGSVSTETLSEFGVVGVFGARGSGDSSSDPQYVVVNATLTPETVEVGEAVEIVATVRNDGHSVGDLTVRVLTGRDVLGHGDLRVESNDETDLRLVTNFDEPGSYDLTLHRPYTHEEWSLGAIEVVDAPETTTESWWANGSSHARVTDAYPDQPVEVVLATGGDDDGSDDVTVERVRLTATHRLTAELHARHLAELPADVADLPRGVRSVRFVELDHTFADADVAGGAIEFTVAGQTLDGADPTSVVLYRYDPAEGWMALPTELVGWTDDGVRYRAETPGFSLFAVTVGTPAFDVTDVTLDDRDAVAEEPVAVHVTVRNDGTVGGRFTADLRADGEAVTSGSVVVEPGASETLTLEYAFAPGEYALATADTDLGTLVVDPPATTDESDDVSPPSSKVTEPTADADTPAASGDDGDGATGSPTAEDGAGFGVLLALLALLVVVGRRLD